MDEARSLTVTLETVTPLFLGGADPHGVPELRAPSFRGALRYWLRAALGGVLGDHDLDALRKAEAGVFGSAGESGRTISAVGIRIGKDARLRSETYSRLVAGDQERTCPGLAYLFFAARPTKREKERSALLGNFTLTLVLWPGVKESEKRLQKAYAALWLLTRLGGIGNRVRRGAGAIQTVNHSGVVPLPNLPLCIQANTSQDLVNELRQGLCEIRQALGAGSSISIRQPPAFDVLHPDACKIWVIQKTYDDWKRALDEIGGILQAFRSRRQEDYRVVKKAMTDGQPLNPSVQRAAFGLPIPFYYRSIREGATLRSSSYERRASPLIIRPVKLSNGKYTIVLVWFRSRFLPDHEQLVLVKDDSVLSTGPMPGDGLISTFISGSDSTKRSSLQDKGLSVLEVSYA